jgi:hypothetical protein
MHPRARFAFAFLMGAACSVERSSDRVGAAHDSLPGVERTAVGVGSAPVAVVTPPATPVMTDPEVRAACAATAAAWRQVGTATVRELDTLLTLQDVIHDHALDTVPAPGTAAGRWAACAVYGFAEAGLDSLQVRALYWPAAGWVAFPRLNADGPGSRVQVYQRGWVRCQVASEEDPGDDGDSTYVAAPFHREATLCWRHGRLVNDADTVHLGG